MVLRYPGPLFRFKKRGDRNELLRREAGMGEEKSKQVLRATQHPALFWKA